MGLNVKLGWCSDGHHPACPRVIPAWEEKQKRGRPILHETLECSCTCHNRDVIEAQLKESKNHAEQPER